MEITVVSEEENPMLHRTDVTFRVSHVEATPDRLAVRDSLAARLNKDADEVVVRKLDTKFGMRTTYGEAKVYESPAFAIDVEQDHVLQRNKIADGEAAATEVEADVADDGPAAEPETADDEAEEELETGEETEVVDEEPDAADDEAEDGPETEDAAADDGAEADEETEE